MIELRSDTFTMPTPQMLEAMTTAELGDDVYGEDPTVARLETRAAELVGQQAACFVPSGTMANLCAILAQVDRGRAVIAGDRSDLYYFEAGGPSVLGGVVLRPVRNLPDGTLEPQRLMEELTLDRSDAQFAIPAMLCVETTHNMCGGVPLAVEYLKQIRATADEHGVLLHVDGARIFNAAIAMNVPASQIGGLADSVQFCLSKGLGAPVGSIVAASTEIIDQARRVRKMLGGGMRQVGVLAAAGLLALERIDDRLAADHQHARAFAESIAEGGVRVLNDPPAANVVFFRIGNGTRHAEFLRHCAAQGVAALELDPGRVRVVFHNGVSTEDAVVAADVVRRAAVLATG
ncbi:MAG: aminotransferase class I/II-fold pyridoxal phosphate-dependent enzyme [Actinomycetota bacterium]|nr:aminotransferase class I/II-fold pyridoxal phosphate-dependent enzyme [Actinomycetota bacterium]